MILCAAFVVTTMVAVTTVPMIFIAVIVSVSMAMAMAAMAAMASFFLLSNLVHVKCTQISELRSRQNALHRCNHGRRGVERTNALPHFHDLLGFHQVKLVEQDLVCKRKLSVPLHVFRAS